eukprot:jgi/Ulvmu1/8272/UM041_0083.1
MARENLQEAEQPVPMDVLVQLLSRSDTAVLAARHAACIKALCRRNSAGFFVGDLEGLCSVMELTISAIQAGQLDFVECMCLILKLLRLPLKKKLCTDGVKMSAFIQRTLCLISACLYAGAPAQLQLEACETLIVFSRGYMDRQQHLEARDAASSGDIASVQPYLENQRLIFESRIAQPVVHALHCSTTEGLAVACLSVLLHISQFRNTAQQMIMETDLLTRLPTVLHMFKGSLVSPILPLFLDVLWNMLETIPKPVSLPTEVVVTSQQPDENKTQAQASVEADNQRITEQQTSLDLLERLISCPSDFTPPEFHNGFSRLSNQSVRQSIKESAERLRITMKQRNDSFPSIGNRGRQRLNTEDSHGQAHTASVQMSLNLAYAEAFFSLLKEAYTSSFDERSKETRNTILAVLLFLVEDCTFCHCANSCGLTELMVKVTCVPDGAPITSSGITTFSMQADDVCHEQIQLLWRILMCMCSCCAESRIQILSSGFMQVILSYINIATARMPIVQQWNPSQLSALRRQAISVLFRLSVLCPGYFKKERGAEFLIFFIQHGMDPHEVECAVRVLRHIAQRCESTRTWLGQHGAVDVALSRFLNPQMSNNMRNEAVMALHALCTDCKPNLTMFEDNDILQLCLTALKQLGGDDPTLPNLLTIQTVAMLWTVLTQSDRCLESMLAQHGIYILMDHMEYCHPSLRPLLMSVIADLLQGSPAAHKDLMQWRSHRTDISAIELLLHLWRDAESEWQVCTDGVLTSVHKPLAGAGKRSLWIPRHEIVYGCLTKARQHGLRAVSNAVDVDAQMRKIYSIFHLIGFSSIDVLDARDQATLSLIEKYVKFKQGEVWMDIASKFHASGFRPTAADRARLQSGIDFSEHLSTIVVKDQARLLQSQQDQLTQLEVAQYQDRLSQAKLEYDSQFYKKDKSKVSAKEKSESRKVRDAMLEASRAATSIALASLRNPTDDISG